RPRSRARPRGVARRPARRSRPSRRGNPGFPHGPPPSARLSAEEPMVPPRAFLGARGLSLMRSGESAVSPPRGSLVLQNHRARSYVGPVVADWAHLRSMADLTHVGETGDVRMVDVGGKPMSRRRAVAAATVRMAPETAQRLRELPKGDALTTAQVAGIMAA